MTKILQVIIYWALWIVVAGFMIIPLLLPLDPLAQHLPQALRAPGFSHWFGTDELGRDVMTRIICGGSISLSIAYVAVGGGVVLGAILGVVAGYFGGLVDATIMRVMDILLVFPGFLLALATAAIIGPGYWNLIVAVGIFSVPSFARVVRSTVLRVKPSLYVEAAIASGAGTLRIVCQHVVPNSLGPLMVVATNRLGSAILIAGGLSFLGLGVQPPSPEWGAMLAAGRQYLWLAPHLIIFPGLAIFLFALIFNILGELGDSLQRKR